MESGLQHNWALAIFQRLVFGRNLFNFSRAALSTAKCVSKVFLNIKINMKRDHGRALTWAGQKNWEWDCDFRRRVFKKV